jgi:hypothetical protein
MSGPFRPISGQNLTVDDIHTMPWLLMVHPMTEQTFIFYGEPLYTKDGYWHYRGKIYLVATSILSEYLNSCSNVIGG